MTELFDLCGALFLGAEQVDRNEDAEDEVGHDGKGVADGGDQASEINALQVVHQVIVALTEEGGDLLVQQGLVDVGEEVLAAGQIRDEAVDGVNDAVELADRGGNVGM